MESQQLIYPQLLSENTLKEILKNTCIEIPDFKTMDREKLIEIYKRVALPISQRKYCETQFGRRLQNLRKKWHIKISDEDEKTDSRITDSKRQASESHQNIDSNPKKIRLSSVESDEKSPRKERKRKNEDTEKLSGDESKRRQKITWP